MVHHIYDHIVKAVNDNILKEPFNARELIKACPDINKNTCSGFLSKHRKGNPGETSELFIRLEKRRYELIRPFKYGFGFLSQ